MYAVSCNTQRRKLELQMDFLSEVETGISNALPCLVEKAKDNSFKKFNGCKVVKGKTIVCEYTGSAKRQRGLRATPCSHTFLWKQSGASDALCFFIRNRCRQAFELQCLVVVCFALPLTSELRRNKLCGDMNCIRKSSAPACPSGIALDAMV